MTTRWKILPLGLAALLWLTAPAMASILELQSRSAGADLERIRADVDELVSLSRQHIEAVGLDVALRDFMRAPWARSANGLHLWGVTVDGISWFDAGHPDLVGLSVAGMADLEGRIWQALALASANGTGAVFFELLYPHPTTGQAARGLHRCFLLKDRQRVLCGGAFQDF
jgi:hypothetical protein